MQIEEVREIVKTLQKILEEENALLKELQSQEVIPEALTEEQELMVQRHKAIIADIKSKDVPV